MNWNEVLIHASSLGCLFTEPREVAAKKAGELSKTAKTHLIKVYAREYWNRYKDVTTKQMEKGTMVETDVIDLLGRQDGCQYYKNELRAVNNWITGHADIITEDEVVDVKASWDAETFLPKLIESLDDDYNIQLQCYMWLYEKPKARLVYGLVNMPDYMMQNELQRLLFSMNVISDMSPEYLKAAEKLKKNCIFDDIPESERIISIEVLRNEEIIEKIPEKVEKARKFLASLHKTHLQINKPQLV